MIPAQSTLTLQPSLDLWLKQGEQVAVKWETFEFHWERVGAMCDFSSNTSTADCNICNYCLNPSARNEPPCFGKTLENDFSTPFDLVMHEGFIPTLEPKTVLSIPSPQMPDGCRGRSTPIAFQPETSATYQITIPETYSGVANSALNVAAETKIHVVKDDLTQTAAYRLKRETVDGTHYWTWEDPGDSNRWQENFSPNLRVTDVQILKGRCEPDPASGKQCAIPDNVEVVAPSRLFFLPNFRANNPDTVSGYFGEAQHRCYADLSAANGFYFNLRACRERFETNPPINEKFATPTYESTPERPLEKLTWLVEFNPNEGGDVDLNTNCVVNPPNPLVGCEVPGENEELIIQFIIKAI